MTWRASLAAIAIVSCTAAAPEPVGTTSSALTDVPSFGSNPAQLVMKKHVPANVPAGARPLVVALHGCSQNADQYVAAAWNALADAWGFYVVYPQQNSARNNQLGCFNWGGRWPSAPRWPFTSESLQLDDLERGKGENQSIKEMVDKMKADHQIDPKRVYVTGLSAGGSMAAVLLATWPDVFAGGALFAAVPYGCPTIKKTTEEAAACTKDYSGTAAYLARDGKAWGDLVRAAAPSYSGPYPKVSLWHGGSDFVVGKRNQLELVKQWANVHGIDETKGAEDQVEGFPHKVFKDASGRALIETYEITSQGHGTMIATTKPVDPANASGARCGTAGAYILNAGICSTYHAAKFFELDKATIQPPPAPDGGGTNPATDSGAPVYEKPDGGKNVAPQQNSPTEETEGGRHLPGGCNASSGATSGAWLFALALVLLRKRVRA
jgi:poly(hydroxyalkanoate) depolymerase family esterase